MTPREDVIAAFELKVPERLPVSVMGGGAWTIAAYKNTFLGLSKDAEKLADIVIETSDLLKSDIVFVGSGFNNFHVAAFGGKIKSRSMGPPVLAAPLVDGLDDLKGLDLGSLDVDPVTETIREATNMCAEAVGNNYMVTATSWGPFTWAGQILGIERLMMGITRNPDFVRDVLDFSVKAIIRFYEPLLDDGIIDMISLAEPSASGNLISRRHFEEFALPYIQSISKEIKKKGAYTFLHICGITNDRIGELGESGVDCISLDSSTNLGYAKEVLGKKMCIAGNVDPINVMEKGSTEDVTSASRKCIELVAEGGGFILMPGCDLSPSVPLSNIRALISSARTWRPA